MNNVLARSQIAIIRLANAEILLAVLLTQRRQMTLARGHFAHRPYLIANRWFDVGPTRVAQQALQRNANHSLSSIASGQHDLWAPSININSL